MTFEAFRDLIKLLRLSIGEETGIALADDENLEQRASAKSTAVGQYSQQIAQAAGRPAPGAPAGAALPHATLLTPRTHRGSSKGIGRPIYGGRPPSSLQALLLCAQHVYSMCHSSSCMQGAGQGA